MSKEITGVVQKTGQIRKGKWTFHNFTLFDDDELYRTGFDKADVKEGDSVTFTYEEGDYGWQVDMKSLKVGENVGVPEKKKKKSAPKQSTGTASDKESYWRNKEIEGVAKDHRIAFNAAFNTATSIITTVCKANPEMYDYFAGNTAKTTKKPGVQLENFVTNVEALAEDIFDKFLHGDEVAKRMLASEEVKTKEEKVEVDNLDD